MPLLFRDRKDLGRILKEAFYIARTGRPGPVVVDIPKNIQKAMGQMNIQQRLIFAVTNQIPLFT